MAIIRYTGEVPNLTDEQKRIFTAGILALVADDHLSIDEFTAEYAPTPAEREADKARHELVEYDIDGSYIAERAA